MCCNHCTILSHVDAPSIYRNCFTHHLIADSFVIGSGSHYTEHRNSALQFRIVVLNLQLHELDEWCRVGLQALSRIWPGLWAWSSTQSVHGYNVACQPGRIFWLEHMWLSPLYAGPTLHATMIYCTAPHHLACGALHGSRNLAAG